MKKLTTLLFIAGLFFTTNLFAQTADSVWWALDDFDTTAVSYQGANLDASTLMLHYPLVIKDFTGGTYAPNKLRISADTVGWSALEPGPDPTRYIQFVVSPKAGYDFHVDSVNFWLACYGTHYNMHAAAYWDTDTNFFGMTNEILYDSATAGAQTDWPGLPDVRDQNNGPVHDTSFAIGTDIPDGGYFALRIEPWYNASSSSLTKYVVLWDVRVFGSTTPATGVGDENSLVTKFALDQNYPNPFNPSTNISFDLEKAGYTTLTIHNVLGQEVAKVLSGEMSSGHHEVNFDASNLSSGVYFYKLDSGDFHAIKKMTLMR